MRYFSVCSGIEAATVAWHRMGWEPVAFSEIEPFPAAVLKHHYPNVPNLGDMTKINGGDYRGAVDVLVGGTPCQAFSVAGLRRGLVDPRGNLTLVFARLADDMDVPFVVWENVPGVLSSKDNAFGCLLGLLAGEDDTLVAPGGKWSNAGYVLGPLRCVAWRVLDAKYFGVAQQRRRVFVVACPRNGADPREILFEQHMPIDATSGGEGVHDTLRSTDNLRNAYHERVRQGSLQFCGDEWRYLTPKECERLGGFPDEYTNIPWPEKTEWSKDRARYKALGNTMAVPVMRWLGRRIELYGRTK